MNLMDGYGQNFPKMNDEMRDYINIMSFLTNL